MQSPRAHGFTLIEIIVSVTLLLVLSSLFMASYNGFNDSQTVKQAASTLVLNLTAVRIKASSGVKPTECDTLDTLIGYIVKFPPGNKTYTAQAVCQSGEVDDITTYTLPTGVTLTSNVDAFTFYALDRGASGNPTIELLGSGPSAYVSVSTSGLVSNEGSTPP